MISKKTKFKRILKKVWHFVWEDNSVWSWIVNIVLAFLIIYQANHENPIIHRIIKISEDEKGKYYTTKGDNVGIVQDFEKMIYGKDLLGRAVFRIPYLGWVKIGFTSII